MVGSREYFRAFSDLRIEAERIIDLGDDKVLVLTRQTARGKLSGAPFEHELADLMTLADGRIVGMIAYWHRAEPSKPWACRSKTLTPTPEPAGYCAGDVAGERGGGAPSLY